MRKRLFLVILVIAVLLDLFTGCPSPVNSTRESVTRERLLEMVNNNMDVTQVDTSHITDMSELFNNNKSFNQDISGWNVGNVTTMKGMFAGAKSFNGDLSGWDVSKVTTMREMFRDATAFNQDISSWKNKVVEGILHNAFSGGPCPLQKSFHPYESWADAADKP